MELTHTFTVPVDVETAWTMLRDIERIAPCMPGATIDSVDGEDFTGRVKVKVGPMQITYKGEASFVEVDDTAHRAVIDAKGRESRGSGTANATITAHVASLDEGSEVKVVTDLAVTGKPAQFGRGVMADVGEKLIGKFAECLAEQLSGDAEMQNGAAAEPPTADPAGNGDRTPESSGGVASGSPAAAPGRSRPPAAGITGSPVTTPATTTPPTITSRPTDDAIDLIDLAGGSVAKRMGPAAGVVALILIILWWRRRH